MNFFGHEVADPFGGGFGSDEYRARPLSAEKCVCGHSVDAHRSTSPRICFDGADGTDCECRDFVTTLVKRDRSVEGE